MIARAAASVGLLTAVLSTAALAVGAPLREITAGPETTTMCGNVVVHANSAISTVLHGDAVLGRAIARLRQIDFETFTGQRKNGETELQRLASDVVDSTDHGKDEVRRLRDYAEHPAGDDRSADLRPFADALDVTFERQKKTAIDLLGFLGALDLRDLKDVPQPPSVSRPLDDPEPGGQHGAYLGSQLGTATAPVPIDRPLPPNAQARNEAAEFDARLLQDAADEGRAQDRSLAAVSGC